MIKDHEKYSLREESVIAPFVEWLKIPREQSAPRKDPVIALFVEQIKTYFEDIKLINFISIYSNLLKYFIFVHLLLIEDY